MQKEKKKGPDRLKELVGAGQNSICTVLIAVRFRPRWRPYHYNADNISVKDGEWVVVPTDHGIEVGQVMGHPAAIDMPIQALPKVERLASTHEIQLYYQNLDREKAAYNLCIERIHSLGLSMEPIRVESFFDGSKTIFYYFAEGRVDFRGLVRDLVRSLRTRVEMRQIGIRQKAKMIGGIGLCGRELCCSKFLQGFVPVSIRMAKDQKLPLNPNKISGLCGRLLCCLTYEYGAYLRPQKDKKTKFKNIRKVDEK